MVAFSKTGLLLAIVEPQSMAIKHFHIPSPRLQRLIQGKGKAASF